MDAPRDPDSDDAHVVALLAAARARDRAPAELRERIERERMRARPHRRRPLRVLAVLPVSVAAIVALVLALVLPSGSPGSATLAQAAALGDRGPASGAPAPDTAAQGARLNASVGEVYFPDWRRTVGWTAVGQRHDRLGARDAITVYYARHGTEVAYTIVATPPLPEPSARVIVAHGLRVRALSIGSRTVVTWRRGGETCVLSARSVDPVTLAQLASWSD